MKHILTFLVLGIGVALGVAAIVLGEGDDSPGLQGLGALLVVGMIALGVRSVRPNRRNHTRPMLDADER